jgi:hypothetical protein
LIFFYLLLLFAQRNKNVHIAAKFPSDFSLPTTDARGVGALMVGRPPLPPGDMGAPNLAGAHALHVSLPPDSSIPTSFDRERSDRTARAPFLLLARMARNFYISTVVHA